ncbi:MAG: N-acetylmuramoyl-L-alanine amidase [Gammaproteobacteria bacterium]|nr:N-acetylmuramoyl-L-alanine amidase [Gammaproteobacteria bacterium]
MSKIIGGKLTDKKVIDKVYTKLHRGVLASVKALVIHQTDAATAQHTFNSYSRKGANGAHFLIDKKGVIYQTALTTQITYHVGILKSRCLDNTRVCDKNAVSAATAVYYEKGKSFALRVKKLHRHEKSKAYPERYPSNADSIGIEIVGKYDKTTKLYEAVNTAQNASLKWLVSELSTHLSLAGGDVYRHPEVSRKEGSEASTASW